MNLTIFSLCDIMYANRPARGRYSFNRASPAVQLESHIKAAHHGAFDSSCPACSEIKAKVKKG